MQFSAVHSVCSRLPGVVRRAEVSGAGQDEPEPGEHCLPAGALQQGEEEEEEQEEG